MASLGIGEQWSSSIACYKQPQSTSATFLSFMPIPHGQNYAKPYFAAVHLLVCFANAA
jgi:hypothetical protein